MRKSTNILLLFCVFSAFFCCKKSMLNFRHKYVGDWKFHTTETVTSSTTSTNEMDYDGKIEYGDWDDELLVTYRSGFTASLFLDKKGNITNASGPLHSVSGAFSNKKNVSFNGTLSSIYSGMGSSTTHKVTGTKK